MLRIWGRITSLNVRKAVWAANELGVPYERIEAGRQFGVVDTPEFHALNPNGLVPVIEDDGFVLWESNSIVRYLAARYGEGMLSPSDLRERASAERWMDWQLAEFTPVERDAFIQLIRTPADACDMALVMRSLQRTEKLMPILDAALEGRDFLVGDSLTIADIPIGCAVHRYMNLPLERGHWPNVERWYDGFIARPAVKGVLDVPLA